MSHGIDFVGPYTAGELDVSGGQPVYPREKVEAELGINFVCTVTPRGLLVENGRPVAREEI